MNHNFRSLIYSILFYKNVNELILSLLHISFSFSNNNLKLLESKSTNFKFGELNNLINAVFPYMSTFVTYICMSFFAKSLLNN